MVIKVQDTLLTPNPKNNSRYLIKLDKPNIKIFAPYYPIAIQAMLKLKQIYPDAEILIFYYDEIPISIIASY